MRIRLFERGARAQDLPREERGPGRSYPGRLRRIPHWWASLVLGLIVIAATALSTYWVFMVPMLQAPDEGTHLDYALSIYSAGRLINVREPLHEWNTSGGRGLVHVYSAYLRRATCSAAVAFNSAARMPPGYGTSEFYKELDKEAPLEKSGDAAGGRGWTPLLTVYPFGYYGTLAAWMGLAGRFSPRLTVLVFGARLFSVLLLASSLLLAYATCRELHLSRPQSLLLTALVGFFPLTSFVSSYIQPDNLTLTLVMLCSYLALRLKRKGGGGWLLLALGMALGALCVTKYHVYLALAAAIFLMVVSDKLLGRLRMRWSGLVGALAGPTIALEVVQRWVIYGYADPTGFGGPAFQRTGFSLAYSSGILPLFRYLFAGIPQAFNDFYLDGTTFDSFWGVFGWMDTPLVIGSPEVNRVIRWVIAFLTVLIFALTLFRMVQIGIRLRVLFRRGKWRRALSIAFSNPLINAYFIFTLLMFGLYAVVRTSYGPQGRNWFAFIVPIFMVATIYAPRAVSPRSRQTVISRALLAGLALYCLVGSYYAIQCVTNRYYYPGAAGLLPANSQPRASWQRAAHSVPTGTIDAVNHDPGTGDLGTVIGWAADPADGAPLSRIEIQIDGNVVGRCAAVVERPDVEAVMGRRDWRYSGFVAACNSRGLAPGKHVLTVVGYNSAGVSASLTGRREITVEAGPQ